MGNDDGRVLRAQGQRYGARARPGDRYALCGSVVVDAEVVADDRPVVALLTSCIACERKRPRVVGIEG